MKIWDCEGAMNVLNIFWQGLGWTHSRKYYAYCSNFNFSDYLSPLDDGRYSVWGMHFILKNVSYLKTCWKIKGHNVTYNKENLQSWETEFNISIF